MTRSTSDTGVTQRTYPMSERSRLILDQISIVTPGYSKTDLMNLSVFWLATTIKQLKDDRDLDMRGCFSHMEDKMSEYGYDKIRDNITADMKVTPLDRFLEPRKKRE